MLHILTRLTWSLAPTLLWLGEASSPDAAHARLQRRTHVDDAVVLQSVLDRPAKRSVEHVDRDAPRAAALVGTIAGLVVDSTRGDPVPNAEVFVVQEGAAASTSAHGAVTNASGRYTITGVPAGDVTVRVRMLGYAATQRRVTVSDGAVATLDFALAPQSLRLDEVIVTGTPGGTQRRAIGNVVDNIKAEDVLAVAPATNVEQLLGQRTPGLIVLPAAGQVGAGAQLRVRGVSSLSLTNEPIIYIDGIRMDAAVGRGPGQRGGAGVSRLNDVNPEDIESIEVIKGPAAATLYGTEASNGVIQIITKRGKTGRASLDITTRTGTNWLQNPEGRAGLLWAKNATSGELLSFNLYEHERTNGRGSIFQNGLNQGYNLGLRGGTDAVRYFTSLSWDDDVGVVSWNWNKKLTGRANLDLLLGDKLKLQTSINYLRNRVRLAQGGIDIDPFSNLVWGTPLTKDQPRRGFMTSPPEEWSTVEGHADNDRTTTSLTASYTPLSWMTNRLVVGLDVSAENNWTLYPRQPNGNLDFLGNNGLGSKSVERASRNFLTLDYAGSAKYGLGRNLAHTSSVGLQYYRREFSSIVATGTNFPAIPITTVSGGATRAGTEDYAANATLGVYFEQQLGWRNRLFLTGAVRADANSAFGKDFNAATYPKASAAWVVSEEPFWKIKQVSELRLRAAWGAAGTQPGTFDASRLYDPEVGYKDQPAIVPSSFGNPKLRPERGEELELGFESSLFGGRIDLSYTHYSRTVKDAIVNRPLPPSLGFPGSQVVNIGRVSGWGHELGLNARVRNGRRFAWDVGTQLATNGNRIDDLGGRQFITIAGGQAQNRVGYSIGDIFMYRILSAKIDAGGFVTESLCDGGRGKSGLDPGGPPVPCATAPRVLWGHSQPTYQIGLTNTFTLWNNLRLYARVDGNGGHYQADTEIRAIHNLGLSRAVILRDDPLLQAYRAIEADAVGTYRAGFLRLREVSATYTVPALLARKLAASSANVSLAGRNLRMLWTAENGWRTSPDGMVSVPIAGQHVWDPETRAVGQLQSGFQTILPPTASVTLTVRLSY